MTAGERPRGVTIVMAHAAMETIIEAWADVRGELPRDLQALEPPKMIPLSPLMDGRLTPDFPRVAVVDCDPKDGVRLAEILGRMLDEFGFQADVEAVSYLEPQ